MTESDQRAGARDRREDNERRAGERRAAERRTGERRTDTCPTCKRILNARGYCYHCQVRVVKIK